jgi:hypothetical protein
VGGCKRQEPGWHTSIDVVRAFSAYIRRTLYVFKSLAPRRPYHVDPRLGGNMAVLFWYMMHDVIHEPFVGGSPVISCHRRRPFAVYPIFDSVDNFTTISTEESLHHFRTSSRISSWLRRPTERRAVRFPRLAGFSLIEGPTDGSTSTPLPPRTCF